MLIFFGMGGIISTSKSSATKNEHQITPKEGKYDKILGQCVKKKAMDLSEINEKYRIIHVKGQGRFVCTNHKNNRSWQSANAWIDVDIKTQKVSKIQTQSCSNSDCGREVHPVFPLQTWTQMMENAINRYFHLVEFPKNRNPPNVESAKDADNLQSIMSQSLGGFNFLRGKSWYLILDTNILLEDSNLISTLKSKRKVNSKPPIIVIPFVVLNELDGLKIDIDRPVSKKARAAIHKLHDLSKNKDSQYLPQNGFDADKARNLFQGDNNDDEILKCCLYIKQKYKRATVELVTRDINLKNKAYAHGVAVNEI